MRFEKYLKNFLLSSFELTKKQEIIEIGAKVPNNSFWTQLGELIHQQA